MFKNKFFKMFSMPEEKAYPGDTYVRDLKEASKAGRPWVKVFLVALFVSFFADLYFLRDTVSVALNNDDNDWLLLLLTYIIAAALVMLYLFISIILGNKLREFMAFRKFSSLVAVCITGLALLLALGSLSVFRLSSEINGTAIDNSDASIDLIADDLDDELLGLVDTEDDYVSVLNILEDPGTYLRESDYADAVSKVFVMTLIMLLSSFIGAIYAYYSRDAVIDVIYRKAVSCIPSDRSLFNKIFFASTNDTNKELEYSKLERDIDRRAVKSAFKLGSIASQLNGMIDPADAHEFLQAQKMVANGYFNESDGN